MKAVATSSGLGLAEPRGEKWSVRGGAEMQGNVEGIFASLIDVLADAVSERVLHQLQSQSEAEDRWMDSNEAADYLGITRNALHKATSARIVPFTQEGRGHKLFFLRSKLDAWRRRESGAGA